MRRQRIAIASLALSASAMVALWNMEGWTDTAVIPVKGDVPTVGPGLTKRPDGSPVQMGDTIKPLEGARRSLAHIQKDEAGLKRCVTAPLHQAEYDLMLDFAYQYGVKTLCGSGMVAKANAGDYEGSCKAYLEYRLIKKGKPDQYDCSTMIDGKRNKRCWGVWTRSQDRYQTCMAAQ